VLVLDAYLEQQARWPTAGRHVLAQFDDAWVVVYQAFRPEIADEAARLGRFGAAFSLSRMSWIKPNFLWMMFRSGWATKVGQERVLAIRLVRSFFERALREAVPSTYPNHRYESKDAWQEAVHKSEVRLQWDPDHDPTGQPVVRRALQLGLRGAMLAEYASTAILELRDITDVVAAERVHAKSPFTHLRTPRESVFSPADPLAEAAIGIDRDASILPAVDCAHTAGMRQRPDGS
jgi:hypothetical protein